jgi:hypothetical protein
MFQMTCDNDLDNRRLIKCQKEFDGSYDSQYDSSYMAMAKKIHALYDDQIIFDRWIRSIGSNIYQKSSPCILLPLVFQYKKI